MLQRLIELHHENPEYSHTVVSLSGLGLVGEHLREREIEVIVLGIKSVLKLPFAFFRLVRLIRKIKPDIVQTWMYHADLIGGLAARVAGIRKVIWGIHSTTLLRNYGVSDSTVIAMKICALLSSIVPHTILCVAHRAILDHVEKGYDRIKMTVIANGFNIETYKPDLDSRQRIRQLLNFPPGALIVGSIGRFNKYKDHSSFISSAGDLASSNNRVYFLLAGRDVDSNNSIIMQWIEETGYADRFCLLGERSDVPDVLAAIDIFCLHSISEAFPLVLGEAMCVGLPSVVTDVGDAALLLGDAGIVVPPNDTDALTKGLLKLIQASSEDRNLLGYIARRRIEDNYSIASFKRQYEELYQKVQSI